MHSITVVIGGFLLLHTPLHGNDGSLLFENFDSLFPPAIPDGWISSDNRSPGTNDFTTVTSSPFSAPHALISTNATVDQSVLSPPLDFLGSAPDSISFFTRRSSSHLASVVLDVSLDDGLTFPLLVGDTLWNPGSTEYVRTSALLPETLSTSSTVRFRWRVISASSGSTGTLRIDDVRITVRQPDDLEVSGITVYPLLAGPTDPLSISIPVFNRGLRVAGGFDVALFHDENMDSAAVLAEQLSFQYVPGPIDPGDSIAVEFSLPPFEPGLHLVIAVVHSAEDDNPGNDSLVAGLTIRYSDHSLVINEILFDPLSSQAEYIEIFNPGLDSIDTGGWLVRDRPGSSGAVNEFVIDSHPDKCPPGGFILLMEDSSLFTSFPYISEEDGLVVAITGGSPGLNNDGDDVVLVDPAGAVVDSVSYLPSWHHPEVIDPTGLSLEKIHPLLNGSDARNWSTTASQAGGTPGRQNSLYSAIPSQPRLSVSRRIPFRPTVMAGMT